jgi:hypothetical protein
MKNKFVIGSQLGYATEQLSNETLPKKLELFSMELSRIVKG